MWLRLRQICLVASELAPVIDDLTQVFGIEVCYVDPGVGRFGLENSLMPVGNQFLEVVAPVQEGTAAGRYLERRGGDGGYMVITQCDDHAIRRRRIEELGIRIAHEFERDGFQNLQMHPKDTGGTFFEIDCVPNDPAADGEWIPAGVDWKPHVRTERVRAIVAAEIQSPDPQRLAARWSEIAEIPLRPGPLGYEMPLENATVRFVEARDDRPEGLSGLDLLTTNRQEVTSAARERGSLENDGTITLCGTRFRLIDEHDTP